MWKSSRKSLGKFLKEILYVYVGRGERKFIEEILMFMERH